MVVLRESRELLDDDEEEKPRVVARTVWLVMYIGWVSSRVETAMCTHKHGVIQHLIRDVPRATPYVFEAMALTQAVAKGGLKLEAQ